MVVGVSGAPRASAEADVRLASPLSRREVIQVLEREVDSPPSLLRCLVTGNAVYWRGTAHVCGTFRDGGFELTSRRGPGFSLKARGVLADAGGGTEVRVAFARPRLVSGMWGALLGRYDADRETILAFLRTHLHAREVGGSRPDERA